MPNLDFYAAEDDWSAVLHAVFDLGLFRVFESDSRHDHELREFRAVNEVSPDRHGRHLQLLVVGAGPEPVARRINYLPGIVDATFRYTCEGWGLIQLLYGGAFGDRELRWSHTNHNTEKRATSWARTVDHLGDPAAWDWPAVTSASGELNRAIRRMAVDKISSHPVLPQAARVIAGANLRYEYGMGIHATPAFGMTS
ncbi:hypothetical protein SAMN05421812_10948 [Asanoa hainanensis]|uniref:Uncharacterized protein n=1 Tax=Asanoa hainanensis TaxID=560556 RepID=A0A239NJR3_9ACTN|nr:hypothetical protein [Asanoa hainanensis]SNT54369.1 hypothetical protein SAMN05421812_10948 [Asanoa hainanensis]